MSFISQSVFRVVFCPECGLSRRLEVEFGRSCGNYTQEEVEQMICTQLAKMYRDPDKYSIVTGSQCPTPLSMSKHIQGYYLINVSTAGTPVPSY